MLMRRWGRESPSVPVVGSGSRAAEKPGHLSTWGLCTVIASPSLTAERPTSEFLVGPRGTWQRGVCHDGQHLSQPGVLPWRMGKLNAAFTYDGIQAEVRNSSVLLNSAMVGRSGK